jgi:5'-methylthioadenosine phosphorylase
MCQSSGVGTRRLAVIVGSGVSVDDLAPDGDDHEARAGDETVTVRDSGALVVLGRHGADRTRPAHRVNHGANLAALDHLGCDRVLAIASTGSLRRDWPVGTVVLPDDFFAPWVTPSRYDDTRGHSVPGFDAAWRTRVRDTWRDASSTPIRDGGIYVQTTGPRFETPAEVRFLATIGDVVGMTVAAECVLAKECGLAYATVCIVDNMANGVDDMGLTLDEFELGVSSNRDQFVADLRRVVRQLASET